MKIYNYIYVTHFKWKYTIVGYFLLNIEPFLCKIIHFKIKYIILSLNYHIEPFLWQNNSL